MDKIIIPLNGHDAENVEGAGFFHSIPWDALVPIVEKMANLRPYEKVDGLIISDVDVQLKISQKPGRKMKP